MMVLRILRINKHRFDDLVLVRGQKHWTLCIDNLLYRYWTKSIRRSAHYPTVCTVLIGVLETHHSRERTTLFYHLLVERPSCMTTCSLSNSLPAGRA